MLVILLYSVCLKINDNLNDNLFFGKLCHSLSLTWTMKIDGCIRIKVNVSVSYRKKIVFILNFMEKGFSVKHSLKPLYIKSLLNRFFCFLFVLIRRFGVLFVCCTAGGSSQWFKEKRKKKIWRNSRPSVRQKYRFNFLSETVQSLRNNKYRRKKGGKIFLSKCINLLLLTHVSQNMF